MNALDVRLFKLIRSGDVSQPRRLVAAISACLSLGATASLAQSDGLVLDEVIVTAQKRSESLQDVPLSISSLGGEALEQRTLRDLEDISMATPGVRFDANFAFGGPSVSIRGISAGLNSATTNFYLDDMPLLQRGDDRTALIVPHVFDLDRVEILRGPQGTLYGAGAMGGAIRYITTPPSLDESSVKIHSEYGATKGGDDAYELSLVGGAPLIDGRLGFRGGVFYRDEGGWIDQAERFTGRIVGKNVNDTRTYSVRGGLLWEPTDKLSIAPAVQYQRGKSGNRDTYWDLDPGFVTRDQFRTPQDTDFLLSNLKVEYDFGSFTAASITSHLDRDTELTNDWTETDADALGYDRMSDPSWTGVMPWEVSSKATTQEFRFSSVDDGQKLSWQAGLYYQKNRYIRERSEYQNLDGWLASILGITRQEAADGGWVEIILGSPYLRGPLSGTGVFDTVTYYNYVVNIEKELAAFAEFDYQLTDRWSVGFGARIANTEFDHLEIQDGPWSGGFQRVDGVQKESPTLGRFNVTYDFSDSSMVYFTRAEGYRLGGSNQDFSNNPLCAPDLAPIGGRNPVSYTSDNLESFEIGTKNTLLGGRASFDSSVYRIDWTDIQRGVAMPTCLNGYTDNLGEAKVVGIDLEFQIQMSEQFKLSFAWGKNNGEYASDTIRFGQIYALKGQEFQQPEVVSNASLYYNGTLKKRDAYATLSVNYNGPYTRGVPVGVVGYAANEEVIRDAKSVTVANLRAGLNFGGWNTALFLENLLGSDDTVGEFLTAASRTDVTSRGLRPRTIGVALDYRF